MLPGKRPWTRQIRKVVSRAVERSPIGKRIRKSPIGRAAKRVKVITRGITLSRRDFSALVKEIDFKGLTSEHVERIKTMTGKQRKELLSKILPERKRHFEELLRKKPK